MNSNLLTKALNYLYLFSSLSFTENEQYVMSLKSAINSFLCSQYWSEELQMIKKVYYKYIVHAQVRVMIPTNSY
jgi:hypothetical protein